MPRRYELQTVEDIYNILSDEQICTLHPAGLLYRSADYKIDGGGICLDGDIASIRYRRLDNDKIYKMKAGKFCRKLLEASYYSKLSEQVKAYYCEEFARRWEIYATNKMPDSDNLQLIVDDDFESIYAENTPSNSGSCMRGRGVYTFYNDAVDAKAASLRDADDRIVARCIIYNKVRDDESGQFFRLAERQYAKDSDELLKRLLVDKLIAAGYIDGYKTVGAGCGDSQAWTACKGISFNKSRLSIECNLEDGDKVSYQDSFKSYDSDTCRADNYGQGDIQLDTTAGSVSFNNHEDDCWSEYHQEYIDEYDAVYVETRDSYFYDDECVTAEVYCSNNGRYYTETCFKDDCIYINGTYYYAGDDAESPEEYNIYLCEQCGEYICMNEDYYYSEVTESYYCSEECRIEAEKDYIDGDNSYYWDSYDECAREYDESPAIWYFDGYDWLQTTEDNAGEFEEIDGFLLTYSWDDRRERELQRLREIAAVCNDIVAA